MIIMIIQFILSLSILVVLHELGHFLTAKWFKTKVEKFYLFFDPGFSLFKKKIGDTEYGIGWLPLGGYVKIAGMIDESMDTEQMKGEPQPWEFRSKKTWQRLIIMLGGVVVNFILGFFLFILIFSIWGEQYLPNSSVKYGIVPDSIGLEIGLKDGDKVLRIGDRPFERFGYDRMKLKTGIVLGDIDNMTIERDDRTVVLPIDNKYASVLSTHKNKDIILFDFRFPAEVFKVVSDSPADKAGMQVGDQFIAINGLESRYINEFNSSYNKAPNTGHEIAVLRGVDTVSLNLTTNDQGMMGIQWKNPMEFFEVERMDYTFVESIPLGLSKGYDFLADQIKAFKQMFTGQIKASESLGGFASIAKIFPNEWIWEVFWRNTAILSLILGFMNLLPIPALDGGHVMFLLYEMISGRKPSDKFMEITTMIGFFLILGLLVFANGLDIMRMLG